MRILIVCPNFPPMSWPCGAADFVSQYARKLHEKGHQVAVLTTNGSVNSSDWPFKVHVVPGSWTPLHMFRVLVKLWQLRNDFDWIDLQYETAMYQYRAAPFWMVFFLRTLAMVGRVPSIALTLHSQGLPRLGGRLWRFAQSRLFNAVVFYSPSFQTRLVSRWPHLASKSIAIGFPTNITRVNAEGSRQLVQRVKLNLLEPRQLLIYFGHISPGRGIEELFSALASLGKQGTFPVLILMSQFDPVETPFHRDLLATARALGIDRQLAFTGRVDADSISRFMLASDACVLPFPDGASWKNGSLAAAIEHGLPVITTQTSITEPQLVESGALLTYYPGDGRTLASHISRLLSNSHYRNELSRLTLRLADQLSWKKYIEARETLFGQAASEAKEGEHRD